MLGSFGKFHVDSIRNAVGSLPHVFNEIYELWKRLFGQFVNLDKLAIKYFIAVEESSLFEEVYLRIAWRVEIFHLHIEIISL